MNFFLTLLFLVTSMAAASFSGSRMLPASHLDPALVDFAVGELGKSRSSSTSRKVVNITQISVLSRSGLVYKFTLWFDTEERCLVSVWIKPWDRSFKRFRGHCTGAKERIAGLVQVGQDQQELPQHRYKARQLRQLLGDEESSRQLRHLQSHSNFKDFVKKFGRDYKDDAEYRRRYAHFRKNMILVQFLRETEMGTGMYGVTQFSDYSEKEKRQFLGLKPELKKGSLEKVLDSAQVLDEAELPDSFDWRDHGAVTPVKNQGNCGSCWAFSVTGNVEGQWKLKTGKLLSLSEQELVDCDRLDQGCNGGLPDNAYKAIKKLGGLETETDYSYVGRDGRCHFEPSKASAFVSGGVDLPKNETFLASWLVSNGPISVGINANAMMFYLGGISHPWHFLCGKDGIDHGVLIVGYGVDTLPVLHSKLPFWVIKNSWGPGWGEQGYYRVYRGDGTCGVNQMASSAKV